VRTALLKIKDFTSTCDLLGDAADAIGGDNKCEAGNGGDDAGADATDGDDKEGGDGGDDANGGKVTKSVDPLNVPLHNIAMTLIATLPNDLRTVDTELHDCCSSLENANAALQGRILVQQCRKCGPASVGPEVHTKMTKCLGILGVQMGADGWATLDPRIQTSVETIKADLESCATEVVEAILEDPVTKLNGCVAGLTEFAYGGLDGQSWKSGDISTWAQLKQAYKDNFMTNNSALKSNYNDLKQAFAGTLGLPIHLMIEVNCYNICWISYGWQVYVCFSFRCTRNCLMRVQLALTTSNVTLSVLTSPWRWTFMRGTLGWDPGMPRVGPRVPHPSPGP